MLSSARNLLNELTIEKEAIVKNYKLHEKQHREFEKLMNADLAKLNHVNGGIEALQKLIDKKEAESG